MKIIIDSKKCCWHDGQCSSCGCGKEICSGCVEICPVQAISRGKIVKIDYEKCTNCQACILACAHQAIRVVN